MHIDLYSYTMDKTSFICGFCEKSFTLKHNLKRHLWEIHELKELPEPIAGEFDKFNNKCLDCSISFRQKADLRRHLNDNHGITTEEEVLDFAAEEDFEAWFQQLPLTKCCEYVRPNGSKTKLTSRGSVELSYYNCHRTGARRQNRGRKIGHACTSQIIVEKEPSGRHLVTFYKTHYGHEMGINFLHLPKDVREDVASEVARGLPVTSILDKYKNELGERQLRSKLITRRDVRNISKAFNVQQREGIRHDDDSTSVDIWVQNCSQHNENPVIFYKPAGTHFPPFLDEDFNLVILNPLAKQLHPAATAVCNISEENFYATVLLTINNCECLPVAFMLATRKDPSIFRHFFFCVKNEIGPILTDVLVFDEECFNEWILEMGPIEEKYILPTYVEKTWRPKLKLIENIHNRRIVSETLLFLRDTEDKTEFYSRLIDFLGFLDNNSELAAFSEFYRNNYLETAKEWASCFRSNFTEQMRLFIKCYRDMWKLLYLQGSRLIRFDKALFSILNLIRDLNVKTFSKNECRVSFLMKDIAVSHEASKKVTLNVLYLSRNICRVMEAGEEYQVKKAKPHTCCQYVCASCSICINCFSCTCIEYLIRQTICIHIHAAVPKPDRPENPPQRPFSDLSQDDSIINNIDKELNKLNSVDLNGISDQTLLNRILVALTEINSMVSNAREPTCVLTDSSIADETLEQNGWQELTNGNIVEVMPLLDYENDIFTNISPSIEHDYCKSLLH